MTGFAVFSLCAEAGPGERRKMKICLGTGDFGTRISKKEAFRILDRYFELGGTLLDTANIYARWGAEKENLSEQYIGQWMKERGVRGRITVATKGGHYDLDTPRISRVRKDCIRRDLEESLRCLGLDRIELYWVHKDDKTVPAEEIVDMMEAFVKEGLICRYGASNMSMDRAEAARVYAQKRGITGFCALQNRFSIAAVNPKHPVWKDPGTVITDEAYRKWHTQHQIPLYAYSSMAQGFFAKWKTGLLTQNMKALYLNRENEQTAALLEEESEKTGLSLSALSLKKAAEQPFPVIPITSVSRAEQLEELKPLFSCSSGQRGGFCE